MAYIVEADYTATYQGKTLATGTFARLAERASEAVAAMSPYIALNGITDLTADELTAVKSATCVMVEHFGAADAGTYSSEKIGSYSYTAAQNLQEAKNDALKRARYFLETVGLTYEGNRPNARPTE